MAAPAHGRIIKTADAATLAQTAAARLMARIDANDARVAICLTGGSSPKRVYALLAQEPYRSRIPSTAGKMIGAWPNIMESTKPMAIACTAAS